MQGLEQLGQTMLLATFVNSFVHLMESTANEDVTPPNDICTF